MKKISVFVLLSLMSLMATAQIVRGDMNGDGEIDVTDINGVVNTMLGKQSLQYIAMGLQVENSLVAGTWYKSKDESITLDADGTTDYAGAAVYKYIPSIFGILFLDSDGKVVDVFNIISLQKGMMVVTPIGTGEHFTLTTTRPGMPVESIRLECNRFSMQVGDERVLTATVLPDNADNKTVSWESSNPEVASISGDRILAVSQGTAVITCKASDLSGVTAVCSLTVMPIAQHSYVDMGLGVEWATCNIGATAPEEYGYYFAWGEICGYNQDDNIGRNFDWKSYEWITPGKATGEYVTKYTCDDSQNNGCWYDNGAYVGTVVNGVTYMNLTELLPEDDAATFNWGKDWRMPTRQEYEDLINKNNSATSIVTVNGVKCLKILSKINGKYILLPAAGYRMDYNIKNINEQGYYLSSSLHEASTHSWTLFFDTYPRAVNGTSRCIGACVRPVRASNAQ